MPPAEGANVQLFGTLKRIGATETAPGVEPRNQREKGLLLLVGRRGVSTRCLPLPKQTQVGRQTPLLWYQRFARGLTPNVQRIAQEFRGKFHFELEFGQFSAATVRANR